ncbi:MAG TPA: alpha/beta hydrolase-fold protein [Verrucomicrobiae bacterium]|nr:alpha/beta hydrolase-fold protein [Verrucomicrobiae bacterium]
MKHTLTFLVRLRAAAASAFAKAAADRRSLGGGWSAGQVALLVVVAAESVHVFQSPQPPLPQAPDYNAYYQIGPDSLPHDGVPKGEVRGPFVLPSQAYPGTQHTYWVYVPAQYDPVVAASLMIFQDGQAFKDMNGVVRAPNVLDNLMYRREIPVMIAVFINPGRTPEQPEPTPADWGDRTTNRPTEYNTLDDKYARVVVDELMPALYKEYNISKDPDRHGIGGASSGAIAAFTVAWQRSNDFRKVLSIVGSFVNLRGGDAYADIVRQSEKKPIRIFLQDGRNDNRGVGRGGGTYDQRRDWFYQNVRLMQALTDKGYDVNYTWGINTHGQRMGGPILPEMMRWLWRDHPVSTDVNDAVERSFNEPKKSSAADDHRRVLDLFHIAALPPGPRSACPETYDEASANPFPTLPDPLVMKNGKTVTSAAMWKQRRAEILEDFEREIYGRTPKVTPTVTWEVVSTTDGMAGEVPTTTKQLVGHVDNSSYPAITVDIQATLTTPRNAAGPVPGHDDYRRWRFWCPACRPCGGGRPWYRGPTRRRSYRAWSGRARCL